MSGICPKINLYRFQKSETSFWRGNSLSFIPNPWSDFKFCLPTVARFDGHVSWSTCTDTESVGIGEILILLLTVKVRANFYSKPYGKILILNWMAEVGVNQFMRKWNLSHRRTANVHASMCIHAVSTETSLFAHTIYWSALIILKGCACVFEGSEMFAAHFRTNGILNNDKIIIICKVVFHSGMIRVKYPSKRCHKESTAPRLALRLIG